ncbi:hypothetical protein I6A60_33140 [Frankia sp. AgB1.9]|uniref:hypothetical protein n=1 Tax=unclassified Frankia TaxID=2632575 RepID=UPI0019341C12|nr:MULTISPECIES: hypothetical protein [unclassified Frankia]MBL7489934.1 hypothetical protein [Frankia sp. AgW1.1]MBL7552665.1 hypothetical protein [Frankia sp. AgB1.9]MBL7623830.1 hypothetical protein [Frankia sp. AgB1.8]
MSGWAVPAAVASALCYAVAAALQQREAARAAGGGLRLLAGLARRPLWLAGIGATAAGATLHVLALRLGPLALVQPIGAAGLLFALPLGALLHRRPVRRGELAAAGLVAAGVVGLLASVQVARGTPTLSEPSTALLATVIAVAAVGSTTLARRLRGPWRALISPAAAGPRSVSHRRWCGW